MRILILLLFSFGLSGEMEIDGDLKVTGTIQNDSLVLVIANLQAQINSMQAQLTQYECINTGLIPDGYCDCNFNITIDEDTYPIVVEH